MTHLVPGHLAYRSLTPLVLGELGFRTTADHFDEPESLENVPEREVIFEQPEQPKQGLAGLTQRLFKPKSKDEQAEARAAAALRDNFKYSVDKPLPEPDVQPPREQPNSAPEPELSEPGAERGDVREPVQAEPDAERADYVEQDTPAEPEDTRAPPSIAEPGARNADHTPTEHSSPLDTNGGAHAAAAEPAAECSEAPAPRDALPDWAVQNPWD